jgi:hypothetical protein
MSWRENIGKAVIPPGMTAEQVEGTLAELAESRTSLLPQDYFEAIMTTVACAVDLERDSDVFRQSLTDARNDSRLLDRYYNGSVSGRDSRYEGTGPNHGVLGPLYAQIGRVLVPRTGRHRVDFFDGSIDISSRYKQFRTNELLMVDGSELSDEMKAIVFANMFQVYTSTAMKAYADKGRVALPVTTTPAIGYERIYYGNDLRGRNSRKGFASYVGFYETFTAEISEMYQNKFGEAYLEAADIVGATLFLNTDLRKAKTTQTDIRDHKLTVLSYVDQEDLEGAKEYLIELYKDEPRLFNKASLLLLFGEDIPESPNNSERKFSSKEDFKEANLTSGLARRYCQEVLGLSDAEIEQRGRALEDKVLGVITPISEIDDRKQYDAIHLGREVKEYSVPKNTFLLGTAFIIKSENGFQKLVKPDYHWRKMTPHMAITLLDLCRYVEIGDGLKAEDVPRQQAQLIAKLQEELNKTDD